MIDNETEGKSQNHNHSTEKESQFERQPEMSKKLRRMSVLVVSKKLRLMANDGFPAIVCDIF